MEPLRVAVCEDMPEEREAILALLARCAIPTEPDVFSDGESLLKAYRPRRYDALLMDICMNGLSGVQTVEKIRAVDEEVPVAFITSSPDYTRESYRLSALSYLEKPVREKELLRVLELARLQKENRPVLVLSRNGSEEKLPLADILYLEQRGRRLAVCLPGRENLFYGKLSEAVKQLEGHPFFSCHKSYCANLAQVRRIDPELRCFVMSDGSNVPIRRESMASAKKAYETYLFSHTREGI